MKLQDWIRANIPNDEMACKRSFERLVCFLRDDFSYALGMSYEDTQTERVAVISTHTSKSIKLPVVRYALDGACVVVRDNFYDMKISVDSDKPLAVDPRYLFDPKAKHRPVYCEGFPSDLVFGPYVEDFRRFTISVGSSHEAWAFAREVRLALSSF